MIRVLSILLFFIVSVAAVSPEKALLLSPVTDVNYPLYLEGLKLLLWGNSLVLFGFGPLLVFCFKNVRHVFFSAIVLCVAIDIFVFMTNKLPDGAWHPDAVKYTVAKIIFSIIIMIAIALILSVLNTLRQYWKKILKAS